MLQVLEQINLEHDHPQLALGQIGQLDLLDGHGLASAPVQRSIDRSEGAFTQAVSQLLRGRIRVSPVSTTSA